MKPIQQSILLHLSNHRTTIGDLSEQFGLPRDYIRLILTRLQEEGHSVCVEKENVYMAEDTALDYVLIITLSTLFVGMFWWAL